MAAEDQEETLRQDSGPAVPWSTTFDLALFKRIAPVTPNRPGMPARQRVAAGSQEFDRTPGGD